jgi:hypothetical protein
MGTKNSPAQSSSAQTGPQNLPLENQSKLLLAITPRVSSPLQPLLDFKDSDIKFNLGSLMSTLRDTEHEGWVLAVYPDPKTSRPLIGAGFSLDLPVREHPQTDPLNSTPFLEPSSAQLWQAAGLDAARLHAILNQFDEDLAAWTKRNFQRKIRTHDLTPDLTEEQATQLLRISAIQAVHNARAYCREFDRLTGPQQMALSQLVFQMGVNLEEFTHFLGAINSDPAYRDASLLPGETETDAQHWKNVQSMLIQSDWARRYSTRAVAVIAMFDPNYDNNPWEAERKVRAQVHPLYAHHHSKRRAASVKTASATHKTATAHHTHQS